MLFYELMINVDTQVYASGPKDRSLIECMVVRLEDVKKLLAFLKSNLERLSQIDPNVADCFEK